MLNERGKKNHHHHSLISNYNHKNREKNKNSEINKNSIDMEITVSSIVNTYNMLIA